MGFRLFEFRSSNQRRVEPVLSRLHALLFWAVRCAAMDFQPSKSGFAMQNKVAVPYSELGTGADRP